MLGHSRLKCIILYNIVFFSNGNKYILSWPFTLSLLNLCIVTYIYLRRNCFSKNISWMAYNKNRFPLQTLFITAAHVAQIWENEILYTIWSYCLEGATAFFILFYCIRALPHSLFLYHSLSLLYIISTKGGCHS